MKKHLFLVLCLLFTSGLFAQRFAWLTDVHYMRKALGKSYVLNMFREIDSLKLDFVVITGDVVDIGYTENFVELKKILKHLKTPIYLTYGNHEGKWSGSAADKFKDYAGMDRFAIDYQGVKFVGFVSTMVFNNGSEMVPIQQYHWLDSVLNTVKPGQYVVAMTHFPMREDVRNADVVSEKFAKHNVQAFLAGHEHKDRYTEPFGIPNLVSDEVYDQPYNIVTVKADGMDIYKKRVGKPESFWINLPFRERPYNPLVFKPLNKDSINALYPKVKKIWQKQLSYPVHASAAQADGIVVFADQSGVLYALDALSGRALWTQKMGGTCTDAPKIKNGIVYLGSSAGILKAFSLKDGKVLWQSDLDGEIWSNVAVEGNKVYAHTSKFDFYALDATTGKRIWKAAALKAATPTGASVSTNDLIIMMPLDKKLYALNKNTGEFIWRGELNGGKSCPIVDPLISYPHTSKIFATPGRLVQLDLLTGKTLETLDKSDNISSLVLSQDNEILYYRSKNGSIKAKDADLKSKKAHWVSPLNAEFYDDGSAPLLLSDGQVYFSTASGYAGALDAKSGKMLWKYKSGNAFINTPTLVPLKGNKTGVVLTGNEGLITFLSVP